MRTQVLGIDIGGVLSRFLADRKKLGLGPDEFLKSPPVEDACETITALASVFGGERYFISKCGWRMQQMTRLWLRHWNVYERTGIPPDHVWFCLEQKDKDDICRVLGVTHHIDDRLEIHGLLASVERRILFCPSTRELERFHHFLPLVTRVESWKEVPGALGPPVE